LSREAREALLEELERIRGATASGARGFPERWRFGEGRAVLLCRGERTVVALHHPAFVLVAHQIGGESCVSYFRGREACALLAIRAIHAALRERRFRSTGG